MAGLASVAYIRALAEGPPSHRCFWCFGVSAKRLQVGWRKDRGNPGDFDECDSGGVDTLCLNCIAEFYDIISWAGPRDGLN